VAHWFTEGLAVSQEGFPMPPMWYRDPAKRVGNGDLMNLDNIHLASSAPSPARTAARLPPELHYVEYLKKTTQGKDSAIS